MNTDHDISGLDTPRLPSVQLTYPNKDKLYRKEHTLPIRKWAIALSGAAAAIVLFAGALMFFDNGAPNTPHTLIAEKTSSNVVSTVVPSKAIGESSDQSTSQTIPNKAGIVSKETTKQNARRVEPQHAAMTTNPTGTTQPESRESATHNTEAAPTAVQAASPQSNESEATPPAAIDTRETTSNLALINPRIESINIRAIAPTQGIVDVRHKYAREKQQMQSITFWNGLKHSIAIQFDNFVRDSG